MIVKATPETIHQILPLAREFTGQIPDYPLNETSYIDGLKNLIKSGAGGMWMWVKNSVVVGAIGGVKYPDMLTGRMVALEMYWFVTESCRGGIGAVKLLKQFESWASESGCSHVFMVNLECSMSERLAVFYQKMGYRLLLVRP